MSYYKKEKEKNVHKLRAPFCCCSINRYKIIPPDCWKSFYTWAGSGLERHHRLHEGDLADPYSERPSSGTTWQTGGGGVLGGKQPLGCRG